MPRPENFNFALVPPFGPKARLSSTTGILKLGRGETLVVERSETVFLDAAAREIDRFTDAFQLSKGRQFQGPLCQTVRDERPRPPRALSMRWELNGIASPTLAIANGDETLALRVIYFPFQVPVREDVDMLVQYLNRGTERVNILEGVRNAVYWADGRPYPSITGWHWDGPYLVSPRCTFTLRFRLADFRDAPSAGEHECSLEILGLRTSPERILWTGEPWSRSP